MEVKVLTFGQLTDITGNNSFTINDAKDTDELVRQLHTRFPALAKMNYIIAVDKDVVTENTPLQENTTVALMPPYAGG